jgi:hypothetical protein
MHLAYFLDSPARDLFYPCHGHSPFLVLGLGLQGWTPEVGSCGSGMCSVARI